MMCVNAVRSTWMSYLTRAVPRHGWVAAIAFTVSCTAPSRESHDATTSSADSTLTRAIADSTQWATYGHDLGNRRFSTLAQITPANIAQLRPLWTHHSGIPH